MASVVFDASTLLISVNREIGWEAVDALEDDIIMSSVNFAEVVTKLTVLGAPREAIEGLLPQYQLAIPPFTEKLATQAGLLVTRTRHRGLSLGDRACLALAIELGLPVITADRAWADLDVGVEIRLIR
jgi:PIN domain nuclease of toxin-antitoxin system